MPCVRVRQNGTVTIPAVLRRKFAVAPGTEYDISVNGKGKIILSPRRCICSLCGAQVINVDVVTGTCSYCKTMLTHLIQQGLDLSTALQQLQCRRKNGSF